MRELDAARLRSLITIATAVGASRRFDDVLELTAEEARAALGAASVSISHWERENGVLRTLINVGELGPGEVRFPADETYDLAKFSVVWRRLVGGETFRRAASDPLPPGTTVDILAELGKASEIATGIVFEGELWGELWATTAHGQPPFSAEDEQFLRAVAQHVAAGLAAASYLGRLETLAFTDPLTGLANRRGLDEHLARALAAGGEYALVVCDVDGLKQINDRDGHATGDQALMAVGAALHRALAGVGDGLAARIGGDEFCLLLNGDSETARAVAARAVAELGQRNAGVTMSCGIATTAVARDAVGLLSAADAAQYAAKRSGADPISVAGPEAVPPREPGLRRRLRDRDARTPVARVLLAAHEHLGLDSACLVEFTESGGLVLRHGDESPAVRSLCLEVQAIGRAQVLDGNAAVPVILDDGRLFGVLCYAGADVKKLHFLAAIVAGLVEVGSGGSGRDLGEPAVDPSQQILFAAGGGR